MGNTLSSLSQSAPQQQSGPSSGKGGSQSRQQWYEPQGYGNPQFGSGLGAFGGYQQGGPSSGKGGSYSPYGGFYGSMYQNPFGSGYGAGYGNSFYPDPYSNVPQNWGGYTQQYEPTYRKPDNFYGGIRNSGLFRGGRGRLEQTPIPIPGSYRLPYGATSYSEPNRVNGYAGYSPMHDR